MNALMAQSLRTVRELWAKKQDAKNGMANGRLDISTRGKNTVS